MEPIKIALGVSKYTLEQVFEVAKGAKVELDEEVIDMLDLRRNQVSAKVKKESEPAYGFNRGFGHNVDIPVPDHKLADLQTNLIRSHACGVGEPASKEIVRATMFLRCLSLCLGHSGVRSDVVKSLVEMLNNDVTPVVPRLGSVGASGDLAPLSHIALAMIGEGKVYLGDSKDPIPTKEAFDNLKIKKLKLEMKEGLALNNGVQYSTAMAIICYFQMQNLIKTAAIASAITAQVVLGADTPFRRDLHELRPHNGALKIAKWIFDLFKDSPIREAHKPYDLDGEVQDPYNIRCAAQILGACYDLIEDTRITLETEISSATDNPLILKDDVGEFAEIVSGGHFHGMPVAVKIYNFFQAMAIMARLSNMRCARFIDQARNKGLPSDLKWPELEDDVFATCSGMMIPEYTSAALTNQIWGACMPTHLMSLSTDAGQEDHVSMSANLGVRLIENIPRLAEVLAIELAMGFQAAAIRKKMDHIPSKISLDKEKADQVANEREAYENSLQELFKNTKNNFRVKLEIKLEYIVDEDKAKLSEPCEKVLEKIGEAFKVIKEDRFLADDIQKIADMVENGELVKIASDIVN